MMQPKKTKYRKAHKGRIRGAAKGGTELNFGSVGLKAVEPERVTARQIEAARRAISRHMKRQGQLWIRVFPDVPVSKKPLEVRMGSGKGAPEYWVCRVKPGRIMFELDGVPARRARRRAEQALAAVGLEHQLDRYPDHFSGGQQQRIAIARSIVGTRRLLLADEPTGALDTLTADRVIDLLASLPAEHGTAVVLVTHEPRFASWADRVVYLRDGRIVDEARATPPEPLGDALLTVGR